MPTPFYVQRKGGMFVDRNAPCFCGSRKKQKKCHADVEAGSPFAGLIQLNGKLDSVLAGSGNPLGCHKGCAACCNHVFAVTQTEFLYACYGYEKLYGEVESLFEKGDQIYRELMEEYPEYRYMPKELDARNMEEFCELTAEQAKVFEWMRKPCLFLDEETSSCKVYEYRPLVCRYHGQGLFVENGMEWFAVCEKGPRVPIDRLVNLNPLGVEVAMLAVFESGTFGKVLADGVFPIFYYAMLFYRGLDNYGYKAKVYREMTKSAYADEWCRRISRA